MRSAFCSTHVTHMNIFLFIIIYLICSTAGLALLKTSVSGIEINSLISFVKLAGSYKFILGFLLYASSFLTWILILSRKDLSYIYPIVIGLSYFFVMGMAVIILRENFTIGKFIGAVLIGLGIVVMFLQNNA